MISILIPYFGNRSDLLSRTLYMLENQTYKDFDVWIIDDGGSLTIKPDINLDLKIYPMPSRSDIPRSPNYSIGAGYNLCKGDFVIVTNPEVIPPKNALQLTMKYSDDKVASLPMLYKLSHKQTVHMDEYNWKDDLDNLQRMENFWSEETQPGGSSNLEAKYNYHHGSFVCATRKVWDEIKIFPDHPEVDESDSYWHGRYKELRKTPIRLPFGVYHQWHERPTDIKRSVRIQRIYDSLL